MTETAGTAQAIGVCAADLLAAIDAAEITHVVTVPDTHQRTLLQALDERGRPPVLRAATEHDAFGMCGGMWVGGARPLAIVQQLGLFAAANALRGITHDLRLPLAILAGLYGRDVELPVDADGQPSAVQRCEPLLDALGIAAVTVETPDDARLIVPALRAAFDDTATRVVLLGAPTT